MCLWCSVAEYLNFPNKYLGYSMSTHQCICDYIHGRDVSILGLNNTRFHLFPWNSLVSGLYSQLRLSVGSFRFCDWFSLWCLVPCINHCPPVSWFSFWQGFRKDVVCKSDLVAKAFYCIYIYINNVYLYITNYNNGGRVPAVVLRPMSIEITVIMLYPAAYTSQTNLRYA